MTTSGRGRPLILAPEVIQASAMDCGPAALASLLRGFGLPTDYARLRQACQTDVDGTSIDRVEEVARQLGLDAEQVMVPPDHLLRPEARLLPALVVVLLPGGITHFAIFWRRHGPAVQVMDPATGRLFTRAASLLDRVFVHTHEVPADAWRAYAGSEEFLAPLRGRLGGLRVDPAAASDLVGEALADPGWRGIAALDAAVRLLAALARDGGVRPGGEATRLLAAVARRASANPGVVDARHWLVAPGGAGTLLLRGAVLLRVRGRLASRDVEAPLPASLDAVVARRPLTLAARLAPFLGSLPRRLAASVAVAGGLAAVATAVEALLLNGLVYSGLSRLARADQIALVVGVAGFAAGVLALDAIAAAGALRLGRRLESQFRTALLAKLPRIADRHLGSWLRSDLVERAHAIALLRQLPSLALYGARALGEIAVVAAALALLFPGSAAAALAAGLVAVAVPLLAQPLVAERDGRLRALDGALSRHYLDALVGGTAARAHAGEAVLCREHGGRVADWERAGRRLQGALVATDTVQHLGALTFAALIIVPYLLAQGAPAGTLLLVFFALRLPAAGAALARVAEQGLALRSTLLRLLEPLDAPEERAGGAVPSPEPGRGCALALRGVSVVAGGHEVLHDVDLQIAAGEHVAVIGASGAGKSTLLGLFLGWHAPASGSRHVEGLPLEGDALNWLRERTAWIDPAVRLWNSTLAVNVLYGSDARALPDAIRLACVDRLSDALPEGLETVLGEEGRLLSGGEGQQVRAARAFARPHAVLAVLDEPFRGLERAERRRLLQQACRRWRQATLFCATHDLEDTTEFDRVLVLEGGRIVESGPPAALRARASRYAELLERSAALRDAAWGPSSWRRLRMQDGALRETGP
jgi:ATP-binding cassette subfamily B protein